jgi:hypothetical protein
MAQIVAKVTRTTWAQAHPTPALRSARITLQRSRDLLQHRVSEVADGIAPT